MPTNPGDFVFGKLWEAAANAFQVWLSIRVTCGALKLLMPAPLPKF